MAKSPPSTPFYWNDYYRDTRVLQPASRGVWMDLLCKLHESGRRGEATMPLQSWLAWCGCPQEVFMAAARDIALTEVGTVAIEHCDMSQVVTLYHDDVTVLVTVKNRRMVRETKARDSDKFRQQRSRESRACHTPSHATVTAPNPLPSSSSSSSLSHWEPPNPLSNGAPLSRSDDEPDTLRPPGGLARLSNEMRELFTKKLGLGSDPLGEEGA